MVKTKNLRKGGYNAGGRKMATVSQSVRESLQCKSKTLKKMRCKKRTAHTRKCWVHLAKEDNLRIKTSGIRNSGEGLYTWKKPFRRNKYIGKYSGYKTNTRELDRKYGRRTIAQYSLCDGPNDCVDAFKTTDNAPRFANDAKGSRFTNNSDFIEKTRARPYFKLRTTKPIKAHSEILVDYGSEYWPRGYFN